LKESVLTCDYSFLLVFFSLISLAVGNAKGKKPNKTLRALYLTEILPELIYLFKPFVWYLPGLHLREQRS
jgi:hypothetical protein